MDSIAQAMKVNQEKQVETLEQKVERLERENDNLRRNVTLGIKVGNKGGVSVYGLGRFPLTLYASQWEKLFEKKDAICEFIKVNHDRLAKKEQTTVENGEKIEEDAA